MPDASQSKPRIKVAVLMGGRSTEREVSLMTGKMVLDALDPEQYAALPVDPAGLQLPGGADPRTPDDVPPRSAGDVQRPPAPLVPAPRALAPITSLMAPAGDPQRPDVCFIALHGRYGEDGTIQGFLEVLGIPYTGSGVLASAAAMNKVISKKLFQAEAIPTPPFAVLEGRASLQPFLAAWRAGTSGIGAPCVVKPNEQGSTIGITIVRRPEEMPAALDLAFKYDDTVLIEQFVEGIEITAALLGNRDPEVLPLVEIVPVGGFYDYERKYTPGATAEIVPARISEDQAASARELARRCHRAFGCRGMSRVDMIAAPDGVWVLEINTIPGMTPTSLLPRAADAAGISFPRLLDRLIEHALEPETKQRGGDGATGRRGHQRADADAAGSDGGFAPSPPRPLAPSPCLAVGVSAAAPGARR